jgi:hypothetical protein
MSNFGKYKQSRLVIGFVSLFSMAFLSAAPFEKNPQNCEMVSTIGKKNKDKKQAEDDDGLRVL